MTPFRLAPSMLLAGSCLAASAAFGQPAPSPDRSETPEPATQERMQWFRDAKLGLFIHWGPSSLSGAEISWGRVREPGPQEGDGGKALQIVPAEEYDNLYKRFNPTEFDADAWMALAAEAGMKYVVFTTKHHDGFSMFYTEQVRWPDTPGRPLRYSIAETPFGRDIVREIVEAARSHGLRVGLYYSTRDWTHPDYLVGDNRAYNDYYQAQVRELLTEYGPVDILWFDHCFGAWAQYAIVDLFRMMYSLQPDLLVNNRAARGLPDIPEEWRALCEADFSTPENHMGTFDFDRAWESCMILSPHADSGGWSYRPDGVTRSLTETIRLLSSAACGDGNMLLNIAPMPTGAIRPEEVEVLRGLGEWTGRCGEAIYGTRGGPWINGEWGGSTHKVETIYVHVFDWAGDVLTLAPIAESIVSAECLTGGGVRFEQSADGVTLHLPETEHDPTVTLIKLTLDRPVEDAPMEALLR